MNRLAHATPLPSLLLASVLLALPTAPALAEPAASGSVRLGGADWQVADVVAYPDDEEIEVVFSNVAFDRAAMAADGKVDSFDALRHEGNSLTLNIATDGPTMCLDMMTRSENGSSGGSTCNSDYPPTITISARSADHIAGSMRYGDVDGEHVHLDFNVAIEGGSTGGAVARPGTPLPADGGAPAVAMLAHFAAVSAGDWEKLKALSHPDRRTMMEASEAAGEHTKLFEFLQMVAPKDIKITGGMQDGEQAQVDYEAKEDGRTVQGTADLVQFEGRWYFVGSTTRD
jgi:hypothetical protein